MPLAEELVTPLTYHLVEQRLGVVGVVDPVEPGRRADRVEGANRLGVVAPDLYLGVNEDEFGVADDRHGIRVARVLRDLEDAGKPVGDDRVAEGAHELVHARIALLGLIEEGPLHEVAVLPRYVEEGVELVVAAGPEDVVDARVEVAVDVEEAVVEVAERRLAVGLVKGHAGAQGVDELQEGDGGIEAGEPRGEGDGEVGLAGRGEVVGGLPEERLHTRIALGGRTGERPEVVGVGHVEADAVVELAVRHEQEGVGLDGLGVPDEGRLTLRAQGRARVAGGRDEDLGVAHDAVQGAVRARREEAVGVEHAGAGAGAEELPGVAGVGVAEVVVLAPEDGGGLVVELHVGPQRGLEPGREELEVGGRGAVEHGFLRGAVGVLDGVELAGGRGEGEAPDDQPDGNAVGLHGRLGWGAQKLARTWSM